MFFLLTYWCIGLKCSLLSCKYFNRFVNDVKKFECEIITRCLLSDELFNRYFKNSAGS